MAWFGVRHILLLLPCSNMAANGIWLTKCSPLHLVSPLLLEYQFISVLNVSDSLFVSQSKVNRLLESLKQLNKTNGFRGMVSTLRSFHSIVDEINEYNQTFCSKFLLVFWLTYGTTMTLLLVTIVF